MVDLRDLVAVHAAAVDSGEPGKRYIIGGTNLHSREIGQLGEKLTGISPKHIGGGRRLSLLIVAMLELGAKLSGSTPAISRSEAYEVVQRYAYYDSGLTNRRFGLTLRGQDSIRWLLHIGKIIPSVAEQLSAKLIPDPERVT